MNDWRLVLLGWAITMGAMAAFAWRTVQRGRELSRQVSDEDTPWA